MEWLEWWKDGMVEWLVFKFEIFSSSLFVGVFTNKKWAEI